MTNEDYAKRAVELGGGILSTMEHGYQGRYIEGYNLAKQYDLKFLFGAEAYWVKDRTEKDKSNCHIFIGAKNENGRQAMNDVLSEANISGFYGQPRLDIPLILSLPKDDVWVTTACVAYWKYEDIESITKDFADHFGKNFYLEVQYHNTEKQAELNRRILRMHDSLKIPIIMGCDSHYIFPGDAQNRTDFLLSKDMHYPDEEGWYLDYPDGDTAYERFAKQSVLSDREIREAMDNTNIFLDVEEYDNQIFNTKIKMPSLYPDWTQEQKDEEYKKLVYKGWDNYKTDVPKERWPEYEEQIASEVQTVIDTKMSDYFIDNYHIIKKGKENGGWLTKSGRGCFCGDALIQTEAGMKRLKEVEIGDRVIDMNGHFQNVLHTFKYDIDEPMIKIVHAYCSEKHAPLICTEDHKILVFRDGKRDWIEASKMLPSDYVCLPIPSSIDSKKSVIDLNDYNVFGYAYDNDYIYEYNPYRPSSYPNSPWEVTKAIKCSETIVEKIANNKCDPEQYPRVVSKILEYTGYKSIEEYQKYVKNCRTIKIKRYIPNDFLMNEFIGMLYGDGVCCNKRRYIGLAINTQTDKNKTNRSVFTEIANRVGIAVTERRAKGRNLSQLYMYSNIFSEYVKKELFVSETQKSKKVNPALLNQSDENLMGIYAGLTYSDGSICEYGRCSFDNTSTSLISTYKWLSNKFGIVTSIAIREKHRDNRGYNSKTSFKVRAQILSYVTQKEKNRTISNDNYIYIPVLRIEKIPKSKNTVYDIEVENSHSYLLNNMVVHNSAVSFLTNKLLGFTEVDRVGAKVKMYPERFMSTTRILQSVVLPDIDFNVSPVEPFAKAQQEILGEDHAYPMVSYGTMQVSAAWKLYAKSQGVPFEIANAISDQIRKYELALKHADEDEKDSIVVENYIEQQYLEIFNKSSEYRGLITSWCIAPCSYLLYEGSIRKEVGLVQVKDHLCCLMDGHWAEENHFLKNDLLKVSVVDLIYRTYKKLGMEPPSVNELLAMCPPEDPAWDVYKRGCTMGINQVEKSGTSARVRNYHPTNVSELCAFVAAIRPGFASMYKTFENRTPFSYNIKAFDNLIQTPEMPNTFVLYQEMEMAVLNYAGIPMDECYTAIKNIAKKRVDKVLAYKEQFMNGFKSAIIAEDGRSDEDAEALAEKLWQIIEDSSRYSFNACLSGDTQIRQIVRANCGGQPSLDAIYKIKTHADGIEDDWTPFWMERHGGHGKPKAWSLCRDGEIRKNDIKDVRDSGIQDLYRVTLSSGDYIDCTLEHKFPTPRGIRKLSMLKTGCILYKMGESPDDPVEELPIISIEYIGKGQTYDVEMGHIAHNFALQNGIITSNSHSYCVAIDSLYGAWLKAHHPMEFYQTYLEIMSENGDKDRMNAAKLEAEDYFGIKFLPFRFNQDNRSISIDKKANTIANKLSAIKNYSDASAKLLYECSQEHYTSFIDVLRWLDAHSFKSSKIIPLIKIDYFQMYGNNRELLRVVEIWDMLSQGTAKKIKKDKLSPEITNIVKDYATDKGVRGNELASWTITDMDGLLKKFESIVMSSGFEDLDYKTKAFNQNEILGYVDMTTGLEEDRFKLYVLDVYPLEDKFNGGIWLFKVNTKSIGSGKTCCLSLKPNVMSKKHITSGSIINVEKREDLYKDKKGYWWLADYDVIS